jgi:hypothetical protein
VPTTSSVTWPRAAVILRCLTHIARALLSEKGICLMSVPTFTKSQRQQSRRPRRTFWITVGTIIALALIGFAAIVWVRASSKLGSIKQNGSFPERYYLNIMSGDYTTAYTYLDKSATIDGQPVISKHSRAWRNPPTPNTGPFTGSPSTRRAMQRRSR